MESFSGGGFEVCAALPLCKQRLKKRGTGKDFEEEKKTAMVEKRGEKLDKRE